jgi:hypothetical protein
MYMQEKNEFRMEIKWPSITRYALIGASIGLVLISIFLLGVKHADPSWPRFWQLRPLIIVPLGGAGGAVFLYLINSINYNSVVMKFAARLVGLIGFVIALWMGTVLGLDGTLWN